MGTRRAFLVTTGSYSDYSVEAVFSTKEKAEAYLAERQRRTNRTRELGGYSYNDYNEIETVFFDPDITGGDPRQVWTVWFDPHGQVTNVRPVYSNDDDFGDVKNDGSSLFSAHADDKEGAIKAAQEKRMQYLAESLGMS